MVEIHAGICDCSDICKNKACEYYKTSPEDIQRHMRITGELCAYPDNEELRKKVLKFSCPYLAWRFSEKQRKKLKKLRSKA
jgi:hypothetical protein